MTTSKFTKRLRLDLPWVPGEHPLELITMPAFGLAMVVCFAVAGSVMMVVGFPSLGFGYWLPGLLAIVGAESFALSCIFFGLSLPIDAKLWEFLYVMAGCAGILAVIQAVDGFGSPGLRIGAGLLLASGTWWIGTMVAWTVSRVFPPPDETRLSNMFSAASIDTIVGGRIRKTLYGAMEETTVHLHYARLFRQLLALTVVFSVIYAQYHAADPSLAPQLVSIVATWGFAFSGLSLMAVLGGRARETAAVTSGSRRVGAGFTGLQAETVGLCATIAALAVLIPAGLSPIAATNFDSLSDKINTFMNHIVRNMGVFTDVRMPNGARAGMSDHGVPGGSTARTGGIVLAFLGSLANVLWILTAAIVGWTLYTWIRRTVEIRRLLKVKVESVERGPSLWERFMSIQARLLSVPQHMWTMFLSWLRLVLIPDVTPRTREVERGLRRFLARSRRAVVDVLMPNDPGAIVRDLYRRMVSLGAKHGAERANSMTPEEYRLLLMSRAQYADNHPRELLEREVSALTAAYTDARYTPRTPSKTLVQRAMYSFRALQANMRSALVRTRPTRPSRGPSSPGDGTGGFRL